MQSDVYFLEKGSLPETNCHCNWPFSTKSEIFEIPNAVTSREVGLVLELDKIQILCDGEHGIGVDW
jgi:hypothetical protein